MKNVIGIIVGAIVCCHNIQANSITYKVVNTGQDKCYNNTREISYPKSHQSFYGQDAEYISNIPRYKDNSDGTITDINTGLMWSKAVDETKVSLSEAKNIAKEMTLGGYKDWRVPSIKELYSLIDFRGYTGFSKNRSFTSVPSNAIPFINTDYFDFKYGNTNNGERYIDAQWLTKTKYVSTTMNNAETLFGVNFADGRIKGYGYKKNGYIRKKFYARYVRGNKNYGKNNFIDNQNRTITDKATGLMWAKYDSGKGMTWEAALKYTDNLELDGYKDWRLPNAKELQSIVDYTRSPDTTSSPAINSIFKTSSITNEAGVKDYPFFWTSTTHLDGPSPGSNAAYFSFGRAIGQMHGTVMDVHGAGAQRSDPKTGSPQLGHGPQGDARRINNFVRCVRDGNVKLRLSAPTHIKSKYPYNINLSDYTKFSSKNRNINESDFTFNPSERQHPNTGSQSRTGFVNRLDKNNDGKVSIDEFDGPKHHFYDLDRNNDGYLSESEAPHRAPHN